MPGAHYTCPDCGYLDVTVVGEGLVGTDGASMNEASCPNCAWSGKVQDTVGFVTTETTWGIEKIGEVMVRVAAKHAVGPMYQLMVWCGLMKEEMPVPEEGEETDPEWPREKVLKHNRVVAELRDSVMRKVLEATITAVFESCEAAHKVYATEFDVPMHEMLRGGDDAEQR